MAEKRKRDDEGASRSADSAHKKSKKGFSVGPQNLPDGMHKRKTQEIKQSLIEKAKIKKNYAKLKAHSQLDDKDASIPIPASMTLENQQAEEPSTAPHPDRQTLIDKEEEQPEQGTSAGPRPFRRKPRPAPFKKEHEEGQRRRAEAEERRRAREEAEQQRRSKIEERERFRSAMAKARTGGRNGQRKLGRESKPLLERVKRLMAEG